MIKNINVGKGTRLPLQSYKLPKGLYFISIITDNKTLTQKLILE